MTRPMVSRAVSRAFLAASVLTLLLLVGASSAAAATWPVSTHLQISAPAKVELGQMAQITARLTDAEGLPVMGADVSFESSASWGTTASGAVLIGSSTTDGQGNAVLQIPFRRTGELPITAVFAGDVRHLASKDSATVAITGTEQQVQPSVGIHIPGIGIWVLGVVLALVWGTYLVVGARATRISHMATASIEKRTSDEASIGDAAAPEQNGSRRDFLTRSFPLAVEGALAVLGGGLLTVLARSPKTHTNQAEDVPSGYDRTPVAYVGKDTPHTPIPGTLPQEISFANDVLPILTSRAGPHVDMPTNSPPPGGMRLDTYKHLMMMSPGEGTELVVPGKPEESLLIQVLTDPGKRMPPIGMPLPESEIQIVASWIVQGAKDN